MIGRIGALVAALALLAAPAAAQPRELFAGADYDPAIPAPEAVIGHRIGDRLTPAGDIRRYFLALRDAAPTRVVVGDYGKSWEGRALPWAAIGSPENIARLDEIRATSLALSDPRRTSAVQARTLIARQPVIVWLGYGVHGNEVGPPEAAMAVARHLLAARGDARVSAMLRDAVVVLVPTQNPDGRDRFIASHEAARGLEPDSDPLSAERAEPWPAGRTNHYLFNLNRDWFAQTQPETRGHVALMLGWRPQVVADAHEMGTDQSFFFPPEAEPLNPLLPVAQLRSRTLFGRAHAAMFDREGLDYFTREVYDAFFPGYGDNWPSYLGAVSMTYEQGSARGLAGRRTNGETITLFDTVRSQFLVSLSTIETAATNRERLLTDFYAAQESAVREGRGQGAWLIAREAGDPGAADALAALLARQGLEVGRAPGGFAACGRSYPAGSYVVDLAQPQGRLAQVLMDSTIALKPDFLAEQERRRAKALPAELYDVTAWALPTMYNTPAARCGKRPGMTLSPVSGEVVPGRIEGETAPVAYVVPADSRASRFLAGALRDGLRVRSATRGFTIGGRRYPSGSLIVTRAGNPEDVAARITRLATASGADVEGVGETWVSEGPSIGSERTPVLIAPRVAMAWAEPTVATSAGAVRYVVEREFGYPVTVIRTGQLRGADLSRYDVLLLPDGGNYRTQLGAEGIANLRGWVRRGGVLVGLGGAVDLMADPQSELLASRIETLAPENAKDDKPKAKDEKSASVAGTRISDEAAYAAALRPEKPTPDPVPGALAAVVLDPDHWMSAGVPPRINVLVEGSAIYTPLTLDKGANAARFAKADELLVAGYLWRENRLQLAYKPYVMVQPEGRGQLIAFTQDPTARGYLRGLDTLFMNAVLRSASFTERVR